MASEPPVLRSSRSYVDRVSVTRKAWLRMGEVRELVKLAEGVIPDEAYVTVQRVHRSSVKPDESYIEVLEAEHIVPVKEKADDDATS